VGKIQEEGGREGEAKARWQGRERPGMHGLEYVRMSLCIVVCVFRWGRGVEPGDSDRGAERHSQQRQSDCLVSTDRATKRQVLCVSFESLGKIKSERVSMDE
jgi:hypothetical protein